MWEIKQVSHDFLGGRKERSIYDFCIRCIQAFFFQHKIHHILVFSIAYEIMAGEVKN